MWADSGICPFALTDGSSITERPGRRWHGPRPDTDPKEVNAMPEAIHPDNRARVEWALWVRRS